MGRRRRYNPPPPNTLSWLIHDDDIFLFLSSTGFAFTIAGSFIYRMCNLNNPSCTMTKWLPKGILSSERWIWLKAGSFDRLSLKSEARRFSVKKSVLPQSCESPLKIQRHLVLSYSWIFKRLSQNGARAKLAENLRPSPFNKKLSNETTFSLINLV
jgi:hypothetical protein